MKQILARLGLLGALGNPDPLKIETVCIHVREDDESHFKIVREFAL